MRLALLLAFWATLVTLVFASYVHQSFLSLNAVDIAGSVHLEVGTRYVVAGTQINSGSDMGARVGRLRDIRSSVCSGKV